MNLYITSLQIIHKQFRKLYRKKLRLLEQSAIQCQNPLIPCGETQLTNINGFDLRHILEQEPCQSVNRDIHPCHNFVCQVCTRIHTACDVIGLLEVGFC